ARQSHSLVCDAAGQRRPCPGVHLFCFWRQQRLYAAGGPHICLSSRLKAKDSTVSASRTRTAAPVRPGARLFTSTREAISACPAAHSVGTGISEHTSRRRTHQTRHARYPLRNPGSSGGTDWCGRTNQSRRGATLTTNFGVPQTLPATG